MNKNLSGGLLTKKPRQLEIKETPLSAQFAQYLNTQKVYHDRLNSGKVNVVKKYFCRKTNQWKEFSNWLHLCQIGTPDRFAILPPELDPDGVGGKILFIEVKVKGKNPTPEQVAKHEELRAVGAIVLVVRSLEELIEHFRNFRRLSLESRQYRQTHCDAQNCGNPDKV